MVMGEVRMVRLNYRLVPYAASHLFYRLPLACSASNSASLVAATLGWTYPQTSSKRYSFLHLPSVHTQQVLSLLDPVEAR